MWRWCSLHWSIPVSSGYGRRIRALVVDDGHEGAVMGLIGLADPVFSLRVRDDAIGWDPQRRSEKLTSVMDAFVLGAVEPYNRLIGGKLVAMLLQSDQLRDEFEARYGHRRTLINGRDPHAQLALITTTSALGTSSIYNRVLREDGQRAMTPVGFTKGTGDFHLSGEIYDQLVRVALAATPDGISHRHESWGTGFRNRREVVQRALTALGFSPSRMRMHGVAREVYTAPLASNSFAWLRGDEAALEWNTVTSEEIGRWWRQRWAMPRSERDQSWRTFDPATWRMYGPASTMEEKSNGDADSAFSQTSLRGETA
nr:Druantia anti-phage system protein DruA [Agromyces sp. Root81]